MLSCNTVESSHTYPLSLLFQICPLRVFLLLLASLYTHYHSDYCACHLATGDMLRAAVRNQTPSSVAIVVEWNLAAFSKEVLALKLEAERELARLEAERAVAKAKLSTLSESLLE